MKMIYKDLGALSIRESWLEDIMDWQSPTRVLRITLSRILEILMRKYQIYKEQSSYRSYSLEA